MNLFKNLSIKHKLTLLAMITSCVALIVACAACMAFDVFTFRERMTQDLRMVARIVGGNCTAALTFSDGKDAQETLSSLRADTHVVAACVYGADGSPFATYLRAQQPEEPIALGKLIAPDAVPAGTLDAIPQQVMPDSAHFTRDHLDLFQTIYLDAQPVGAVFVRSDLDQLWERIHRYGLILIGVLCAATSIAYVLARRLQRLISDPVQHLAETARVVSKERNYTVRAVRTSDDELGLLMDGFNEMLQQIQERDAELQSHREHLEDQVARRTAELQKMNLDLTAARDRAEEASRAKTYFLANMSHEIRTPMTAIIGYADMMLEPDQTLSDRQDCLQVVRRSGRHLMDLIDDILDISKIEAGRMTVERVDCDLPSLVIEVASLMRPRAAEKDLLFRIGSTGPIPKQIKTDPLRLRQILMNLASNAIKFTQRGQIDINVRCFPAAPCAGGGRGDGSIIQLEVIDTGIGMTEEQISRLFQPFTQADESMTRRFGGTGLGLVISKRLAGLLGGDITVSATPGIGSTFTLRIDGGPLEGAVMLSQLSESILDSPMDELRNVTRHFHSNVIRLGGRILLAEDGLDNQRLISAHLRRAGAEVVVAENGRIAVDLMRDQHFDLMICDMQMPELDGYGATSELRRRGFTLPIIALTAHAMAEDRAQCLKAGCTDYLTKPIEKDLLLGTIRTYLQKLGVPESPAPSSASGAAPPTSAVASGPAATGVSEAPDVVPAPTALATEPNIVPAMDQPETGAAALPRVRSDFAADPDMKEIIEQFIAGLPTQVSHMQQLLAEQNLAELRRSVHQMKGAGGGYGFPQISRLALHAEEQVKQGGSLESIETQVKALLDLVRRVEGYNPTCESPSGGMK